LVLEAPEFLVSNLVLPGDKSVKDTSTEKRLRPYICIVDILGGLPLDFRWTLVDSEAWQAALF